MTRSPRGRIGSRLVTALATGAVLGAFCEIASAQNPEGLDDALARGAYLSRAAGCMSCHTLPGDDGQPFAGGRALETPFGTFYSPNITPDPETGIGEWSDEDFVRALRSGEAPEGHLYYPVFPYPSYTRMREDDMLAIKDYLFSLVPVRAVNKKHDAVFPLGWRFLLNGWTLLNFDEGELRDDPDKSAEWNRGRYLVDAMSHCGECHTPRGLFGGTDSAMYLAGTRDGPDGELVPNITPHETGIADWSEADIAYLLQTGMKPSFDDVQGSMAEAVEDGLSHLTEDDLNAIAVYLKSVPPIENRVERTE